MGLDIELADAAAQMLGELHPLFTPQEADLMHQADLPLTLGFSIKETLFKSLNPLIGKFIDFPDLEIISLERDPGIAWAEPRTTRLRRLGACIRVHWKRVILGDHPCFLTLCRWPQT